jgi:hypothetical protein
MKHKISFEIYRHCPLTLTGTCLWSYNIILEAPPPPKNMYN